MSSLNASAYELPRATGSCASTGRAFEPGEPYFAALVETETSAEPSSKPAAPSLGFARVDVSAEAWDSGYRPERLFSFWKTTQPEPNAKKSPWADDSVLLDLLERLADTEDRKRLALRHVITLVLMRKKLLRYDGAEKHDEGDETRTVWQLTPKLDPAKGPLGKWNEDRQISVLDPGLTEDDVALLIEQLGQIVEIDD
ncbi:hypothetical protein [Mucisphaera calidilacus]|uniref:Uncharacterized protein n=1 Tax=Mucisphaera calidilacus TaxID=2527982 RepID=A0A518BWG1_9BACT|nr:hypothetical protein [Mucisphaera calidilacus]QDU71310.1 hypothetical protein Pan265_11590 [Mucisphaera calidilacus]